jgi:hypothetical protein
MGNLYEQGEKALAKFFKKEAKPVSEQEMIRGDLDKKIQVIMQRQKIREDELRKRHGL